MVEAMEIKLNKTETTRMLKVKAILEDAFDNGNLRKYGFVPYTLREIASCYNGMIKDVTHSTVTGFSDIKEFFEKRGFLVEPMPDGSNGWDIYISERMKKSCCG